MKKLLLLLLCVPLMFSCGEKENNETENNGECVSGDCENGQGTYTWDNGDKYEGEWKDGLKHGQGTNTWGKGEFEGDKYVGAYKNDKKHGQGTYTLADGTVYKGLWENDKFIGE